MRYITGEVLNSLLHQLYSPLDIGFQHTDYRVDFWDFVGSQSIAKILDFEYRELLKSTVALRKLYEAKSGVDELITEDIKPLYMCFIHYMSVVGIQLYLTSGIKLHFTIPLRMYERGISCELVDAKDDCLNIIDYYPTCTDLNYYLSVVRSEVRQFNYKSLPTNELDFEYLSKMKMYYDSYKSDIMVIERRQQSASNQ